MTEPTFEGTNNSAGSIQIELEEKDLYRLLAGDQVNKRVWLSRNGPYVEIYVRKPQAVTNE